VTEEAPPGGGDISLERFISECQRLVRAPGAVRQHIEDNGVMLIPADFYSTVPLLKDLDTTFEGVEGSRQPLYDRIFDRALVTRYLQGMDDFADEFDPPVSGDEATCTEFFWGNSQFSYGDAMAYYCLVRWLRPRRIVEIGSGFSTLVADAAIRKNGSGEIVCIDPYPRPFLSQIKSVCELIAKPIQAITPASFARLLAGADILFIDSTHTVKIGSDCLYIYLVLMPSITQALTVHSHDIFLPFGMPLEWSRDLQIHWTEQYLLYAYLLGNRSARAVFSSAYAVEFLRDSSERLMRGRYGAGGGSLWYQLNTQRQNSGSMLVSLARRLRNIGRRGV
jgi:methyltransferase family protein